MVLQFAVNAIALSCNKRLMLKLGAHIVIVIINREINPHGSIEYLVLLEFGQAIILRISGLESMQ